MSIKKKFFEFALWLTILTLFILAIYQIYYLVMPESPSATLIHYVFLVPYLITLLVFLLQLKAVSFEPQYFVQIVILSIVVKLIIFGAFNFIMIWHSPEQAMPNVIWFFIIYLPFTIFEIAMVYPLIRDQNNPDKLEV